MRDLRLAIVHNTIAPYRHPLFEFLSERLDLTVYYCQMKERSREWDPWPRKYDYKHFILSRIPIGSASLNPSIIRRLLLDRPDVVVVGGYTDPTMWLAFTIAKLLRIPLVYWTEGTKEPTSFLGLVTRPLRTIFIRKSHAIVVPGRLSRDYVIRLGADVQKVFVARNAIDNDLFAALSRRLKSQRRKLKVQLGLTARSIILYVGRLDEKKGVQYLLEAYKRLKKEKKDTALVIVGYGSLYNSLKELCEERRISDVLFAGAIANNRQLIRYYSAADILVLPTLEDVWGFVINEGMACGIPIIATSASQAAIEMIREGENGFIVKEADSAQLYDALRKLVSDDAMRKRMARKSEIIVGRFDRKHMSIGFVKAIDYAYRSSS